MRNVHVAGIIVQMWAPLSSIQPFVNAVPQTCLVSLHLDNMRKHPLTKWLSMSAVILALDLYTKHLVQQAFAYGDKLTITSYFDLVRYHNEGAAFSFLADAGGWQKWFLRQ